MLVYLSRFARLLTTPVILGGFLGLVNVLRSLPFLIEQTGDRLQEWPVPCHSLLLGWGESSQQGSMRRRANVRRSGRAHDATNKEHHVCARRRVGEPAGSSPPGIRRRKAGTDQGTAIARSRLREFQKASAPDCRGRGAARGAEARGRMPPCAISVL